MHLSFIKKRKKNCMCVQCPTYLNLVCMPWTCTYSQLLPFQNLENRKFYSFGHALLFSLFTFDTIDNEWYLYLKRPRKGSKIKLSAPKYTMPANLSRYKYNLVHNYLFIFFIKKAQRHGLPCLECTYFQNPGQLGNSYYNNDNSHFGKCFECDGDIN